MGYCVEALLTDQWFHGRHRWECSARLRRACKIVRINRGRPKHRHLTLKGARFMIREQFHTAPPAIQCVFNTINSLSDASIQRATTYYHGISRPPIRLLYYTSHTSTCFSLLHANDQIRPLQLPISPIQSSGSIGSVQILHEDDTMSRRSAQKDKLQARAMEWWRPGDTRDEGEGSHQVQLVTRSARISSARPWQHCMTVAAVVVRWEISVAEGFWLSARSATSLYIVAKG